jgi:diaminohydroxyphosphoribosylaminopyrimidine deaminase/5-amino-6-(5-phosphoribosylamino)uracil reductase
MVDKQAEYYMRKCFELARKGFGKTNPNPMVGALIVKNNKIISQGWHKKAGSPHAEVIAIRKAKEKVEDSTLYVNLEPCSSYGRTPPCVDEIIKAKIKKVVIACPDLNPLHNGRGIKKLKLKGINVKVGILEKEAKNLNKIFFKYIKKKIPWVTIKIAQSIDGKIATAKGDSKWITSKKARNYARTNLRSKVDAIIVGINTVIKDNPSLTARKNNKLYKKQPIRIILDSNLKIPLNRKIFKKTNISPVIIATTKNIPLIKKQKLAKKGIEILICKEKRNMVDLVDLMKKLALREISHVLVEGGGEVISSFLKEKLADEIFLFISPMILGGDISSVRGEGFLKIENAPRLKNIEFKKIGNEFLIKGEIWY